MAKKELSKDTTPKAVAPWQPNAPQDTAVLELHDRILDLNVAGHRRMQVSLDPVELGVGEFNLSLPGIRIRIAL